MINVNEAIQKIKSSGSKNARTVPMPGADVNTGLYQIELCSEGAWSPIIGGITKSTAEGIISQATNRVILG